MLILRKLKSISYYATMYWYYKLVLGHLGKKSVVKTQGLRLEFPKNIYLGNRVVIGSFSWLAASPYVDEKPKLTINDHCNIGRFNQIYTTTEIVIEEYVLTADRVFISDSAHDSTSIDRPIMSQKITSKGPIRIGSGSWIGINACIIGASIGRNCVVAANSVVIKDVPDFCIVGGIPAVILKRFNKETGEWQSTDANGTFK